MVSYFLHWTLLKIFNSIPDNHCQQVAQQLGKSHAQWLIHKMMLSTHYCGNFAFIILERVLVGSIVNIGISVFFFFVHGEWIGVRTKKLSENRFAVHTIGLSRASLRAPWAQRKRHSFLKRREKYNASIIGPFTSNRTGKSLLKRKHYSWQVVWAYYKFSKSCIKLWIPVLSIFYILTLMNLKYNSYL